MNRQQARQTAIARAQALLKEQPLFLDTETTGIHETAEIVEIALLDHAGQVLVESLVKPRQPIPSEATRIHDTTAVQSAPTWAEVWSRVAPLLAGRTIGIYNADYDLRLLRQSHRLAGLPWQSPGPSTFCIMQLYAQYFGDWNRARNSFRWQSLEAAGQQCGLNLPNSHRAQADAQLARAVLHHMAAQR
jgi:DNA polymerase III subunit epsilon